MNYTISEKELAVAAHKALILRTTPIATAKASCQPCLGSGGLLVPNSCKTSDDHLMVVQCHYCQGTGLNPIPLSEFYDDEE